MVLHRPVELAKVFGTSEKPLTDKTSCAVGASPSMKIESPYDRAVNRLFSVGVGFIFIAEDLSFPIEFEYWPKHYRIILSGGVQALCHVTGQGDMS
jgi:hypothetical protein